VEVDMSSSVRGLVPARAQEHVRSAYVRAGVLSSAIRLEPGFMLIGAHRCGSTSLFKALAEHPQISRPPVNKGTDYYTLNYWRGHAWFRGHFGVAAPARLRARRFGEPVAFEACTYYMFHPLALERIRADYPEMKFIVSLRDPVERAFSAYKHELARGFEWETPFERALDLEEERLVGELDRIRADPTYESFAHRHHAYVARGQYAEQLDRAFSIFPREQFLVLDSDAFFSAPAVEYDRIVDFLGLRAFRPDHFDQHNARPSAPMSAPTHERLTSHFAPWDEALMTTLGHRTSWMPTT
jgi:hypothetical protein